MPSRRPAARRNPMPSDAEAKRRLQKHIDALPLPPGANATVISARVRPGEEGYALEYEVGGYTDLDRDSILTHYRDDDLHSIVSDALGVRRGDEEELFEDVDVLRDNRTLRNYPGFSVIWSGTFYDDGKGFVEKLLHDTKSNPARRPAARHKNPPKGFRIAGPSVKTMVDGLRISKDDAERLKDMMDTGAPSILQAADKMMNGHGVERIPGRPGLMVVNMGDAYDATLVYDYKTNRFVVSSWGDIVERQPRRFPD